MNFHLHLVLHSCIFWITSNVYIVQIWNLICGICSLLKHLQLQYFTDFHKWKRFDQFGKYVNFLFMNDLSYISKKTFKSETWEIITICFLNIKRNKSITNIMKKRTSAYVPQHLSLSCQSLQAVFDSDKHSEGTCNT